MLSDCDIYSVNTDEAVNVETKQKFKHLFIQKFNSDSLSDTFSC